MTTYPDVTASQQPHAPSPQQGTGNRVDWAPVPRVDLLPPEIGEARRLAGLKRVLAGSVVAVVLGCAGAVLWAQTGVSAAQDELDAVQARSASLHAEQAKYAAVPRVVGLIDAVSTARQTAMAQDVLWYGFLSDLGLTTPRGVSLLDLEVSLDDTSAAAAPSTDPLASPGIGRVTFSGKAAHFPDVATWLDGVGTLHGLDGSTLQTATRAQGAANDGTPITFTSTVQVTRAALTHRYDRKAN